MRRAARLRGGRSGIALARWRVVAAAGARAAAAAADRGEPICSRSAATARVESVSVSAWPAIEAAVGERGLGHRRAPATSALTPAQAADAAVGSARHRTRMDVSRRRASATGALRARPTRACSGHGARAVRRSAAGMAADVAAALPAGHRGAAARQRAAARSGSGQRRAVRPRRLGRAPSPKRATAGWSSHPPACCSAACTLTLFSDPHVYVEGVAATSSASAADLPAAMTARLR